MRCTYHVLPATGYGRLQSIPKPLLSDSISGTLVAGEYRGGIDALIR